MWNTPRGIQFLFSVVILACRCVGGIQQHHMEQLDVTEATVFQEGGRLEFHECSTHAVPDGCRLVMAESSIAGAGWGVFSLEPLKRGQTLGATSN